MTLLAGCFGTFETERMEQIRICEELCAHAVEEAIYAEGASIVIQTSNLRCRCVVRRNEGKP